MGEGIGRILTSRNEAANVWYEIQYTGLRLHGIAALGEDLPAKREGDFAVSIAALIFGDHQDTIRARVPVEFFSDAATKSNPVAGCLPITVGLARFAVAVNSTNAGEKIVLARRGYKRPEKPNGTEH